ncbi:MAG: cation-translocating P-type ATPase, partial [Gammaproteobacteria bacterium]|nr:cation-translocating P-type ATPase [Gammaproteobacteria bacterium]
MSQATEVSKDMPDRLKVKIIGMDCGSCAMTIENSMRQLDGVQEASVSFTTESMEVSGDVSIEVIKGRLKELGYRVANEEDAAAAMAAPEHTGFRGFIHFLWEQPPLRVAVVVTASVLAGLIIIPALGLPDVMGIPALSIMFGAAVIIAGAPVFIKGFRALIFAHRITIDLLMAIAALGAIGIGETGEACTVILLFMLGEALEAYSAERARDSLRTLISLQPQEATVLEPHGDSHQHSHEENHKHGKSSGEPHYHQLIKAVELVIVGDRVLVRPGQRIPIDGEVIKGISSVNQAPVTGEAIPVLKEVGADVMAGTVNGEAALELRVTRPAAEGTIARIARLVEQAQSQRSPAERFIDRFARYYTPAVVALAVIVVAIAVLGFAQPFLDGADGTRGWLYRGLTLLIIACPCALVISIPVTVVSGMTRLAQLGILIKSGALLDRMADVQTIGFDKTGTLTYGKPVVVSMQTIDCEHNGDEILNCIPCDKLLSAAASIERASEHPVAHAIVTAAGNRPTVGHVPHSDAVQAMPGKGVSG